jgi:hypothetical protein
MTISNANQIQLKILELKQEHQDLHHFIDLISKDANPDQLRLKRLKKRKLLKCMERKYTPL